MIWLILTSVFLGAFGQILVKYGATRFSENLFNQGILHSISTLITNIPVVTGAFLYGISFLIWIKVLSKVELSYAYPMVSIGYIFVMVFSYFVFKENITLMRLIGVSFIIIGVIFITKS